MGSYVSDTPAISGDETGNSGPTTSNSHLVATASEVPIDSRISYQSSSIVQPLPNGVKAMPGPSLAYHPVDKSTPHVVGGRLDTSLSNPPHTLLDLDTPSRAQFATYRDDPKASPRLNVIQDTDRENLDRGWIPWPLRPWFWIPFILVLLVGAIGLEVALHFSKRNQGWPSKRDVGETNVLHYVYTLPPVAVAAILVAMWTWTDIEIKKMQPYVDLVHGDSPPHRSLLLDYTRNNNFVVWTRAASNKHYVVALASLMVVLSFSFQPLAAALLVVRDTWWQEPDATLSSLAAIGLNQDLQFNDLTSFLTASGYASASVLYDLADPPFIRDGYTVAEFELPRDLASNGTVFANTTALKSETGCLPVTVNMTRRTDAPGWENNVSYNGCTQVWSVDNNSHTLFGTDTPTCNQPVPPQFSPVIFWFFTYLLTPPRASATFCYPSFTLWDVSVSVDLASGNLTKVTELRPFSSSSNFSFLSANVTGPPLNGRAYNGIKFNLTDPDEFVLARQNATQLQLPAAVYQSAVQSPEGLVGSFEADKFVQLSNQVYRTYLTLVAKTVYFLPTNVPITLRIKTVKKRVWLSDTAVHLLAAAMLLLALFGSLVHLFHRFDRRNLRLRHEPGTIASAVSIGAQTGMGNLLAGRQNWKDISEVLQDKKFRIDPSTMKIIMEGEEGYEHASSPAARRRSIFAALQGQQRSSRSYTKSPGFPTTPQ